LVNSNYGWSGGFPLDIGQLSVKIKNSSQGYAVTHLPTHQARFTSLNATLTNCDNRRNDKNVVLRVEGKLESPTVFMFLKAESEAYPLYRIENRADETLIIAQKGTAHCLLISRTFGGAPILTARTPAQETEWKTSGRPFHRTQRFRSPGTNHPQQIRSTKR